MFDILLLGLGVVVAYAISHYTVMWLESMVGAPLGIWRSLVFFCVFLVLFLVFRELVMFASGKP